MAHQRSRRVTPGRLFFAVLLAGIAAHGAHAVFGLGRGTLDGLIED